MGPEAIRPGSLFTGSIPSRDQSPRVHFDGPTPVGNADIPGALLGPVTGYASLGYFFVVSASLKEREGGSGCSRRRSARGSYAQSIEAAFAPNYRGSGVYAK